MKYAKCLSPKKLKGEKWLPVEGFEGRYNVSNFGRIMSLMMQNAHGESNKRKIPLIRKQKINTSGYYEVRLMCSKRDETLRVHRLVAAAFIQNPLNLPEVNHLKGKLDNRVASIEWSSSSDNQKHAYQTGLKFGLSGEKNPKCRLSEKDVLKIFNSKQNIYVLAEKFDISIHTITHIKRGSTWSYLTGKKYIIKSKR